MWQSLRRALSAATVVLAATAIPAAPLAAQSTFTDFASFLGAVGSYGVDSFDDLNEQIGGPLSRAAGGYGYQVAAAAAPLDQFFPVESTDNPGDWWLSEETAGSGITFSGFDSSIRGIGGFFFATDFNGTPVSLPIFVRAKNVHGAEYTTTLITTSPDGFFGVVFDDQVASLFLSPVVISSSIDFHFATVNNLVLAEGATKVPEPLSAVLLVPGAMLLWRRSRRRNLSAAPHA